MDSSDAPSLTPNANALPPEALDLAQKLFDFARNGETASLAQYLESGIPKNMRDSKGNSFLMLAAYHGNAETVEMLLALGADANLPNDRGQSPLAGAVFKGHTAVAETLVQSGVADPMAGTPNAVDCAVMFKRDDILELFKQTKELSISLPATI